mgnify:CR=1 FL=1
MHSGLCLQVKMLMAGFAYNAGNVVPAGVKVAVVGKNTQNALRTACGIEADYVSSKATGLALGEELMNAVSGRVVYLCAEVTSGSLEEAMKEYENLIKIQVYRMNLWIMMVWNMTAWIAEILMG